MGHFSFKILHQDKKSQARTGEIMTPHGKIKTPAFIPVGTQAAVKSLIPQELKEVGTQIFFVNTYHTYLRPGAEIIQEAGGLHRFMNWDRPLITDSGGFQVFSLAKDDKEQLVKIDNDGVTFKSHWDGTTHRFTPEKSIKIQEQLGADIILTFDDCAPYPVTYEKAYLSMSRTHRWALRSLAAAQGKQKNFQALYGIVQGSVYKDLRIESAKFIAGLPFSGIAIGGMAVGESKEEMCQVLDWIMPLLPSSKPRHLLGVGEVDDIFEICERGIDTFDCVMPTRLGRMGQALIKIKKAKFKIDITKAKYASDVNPIEKECNCFTCRHFSRAYLNHLFRVRELLGYRLLTIHNLYFINQIVEEIRRAIEQNKLLELKKEWLV